MKSNPDPILLGQLASFGFGFDCASGRELEEVAKLGISIKDHVIYANPCKPNRDLALAKQLGSPTTVVDSFEELDKLQEQGYTGKSLIRILVDDKNSLMPFSRKFGIHPSHIPALSKYAKVKGIDIDGVSFHVGSGCKDRLQYKSAIELGYSCNRMIREVGFQPTTIDIGGGFLSNDIDPYFKDYASVIRASLNKEPYRIIAEPGRFFSSNAFDLFVQVIGKKPDAQGKRNGWRYTIDESLYGQFSCIPFDQKQPVWIRIPSTKEEKPRQKTNGILFGRTCDSLDLIAKSPSMEELDVGDWLWFPNMGAYTSVTASEFNGFPKPPVFQLKGPSLELPFVEDLKKDNLKDRLPYDVTGVNGVTIGSSSIPAVA